MPREQRPDGPIETDAQSLLSAVARSGHGRALLT